MSMGQPKNEPTVLLQLMACLSLTGHGHDEIAEVVGRSRENVTRSLESPAGMKIQQRLRDEATSQIFDPVTQQLDSYAREAMQDLWAMRNTVEAERLKKDILVDVLHMAGYRPHTNTDRQAEQLPTVIMGTVNMQINNRGNSPNAGPIPPAAKSLSPGDFEYEHTEPSHEPHESTGTSNGESLSEHEVIGEYHAVETSDDPRFESIGRWTSGPEQPREDSESSVSSENSRSEQFEPAIPIE
jgi:hypothetical protein